MSAELRRWGQRKLLLELARNDFRVRYAGSFIGALWAFVQPVLTILLYLFIYQVGFRSAPPQQVPFVLWLIVGIAPWFFFVDGLASTTRSLVEYAFLVKKVMFEVSIIPLVKLLSSSFIHLVVWGIVITITLATGHTPTLAWLYVPYWFVALFLLLIGIGSVTAVLTPFFRDLEQIVTVVLQFGFWLTPVMWPIENAPARFRFFLSMNPLLYVVDGLRGSLLLGRSPLASPMQAAFFWAFVIVANLLGLWLFRRLRPHLADIL